MAFLISNLTKKQTNKTKTLYMKWCRHFMVGKSHQLQLLRNCFCPQTKVRPVDYFLMLPFQNIHSSLNGSSTVRMRAGRESDGGMGWLRNRVWPWKSPPGGVVEGQQGAPTVHKACLVWDKRRAPGGPCGTIFTITASLFSLGLSLSGEQHAGRYAGWRLYWVAPLREKEGLLQGGPGVSGALQHLPLFWLYLFI